MTAKQKRGFAAMPKDKQREIARKGGESSHRGRDDEQRGQQGENAR